MFLGGQPKCGARASQKFFLDLDLHACTQYEKQQPNIYEENSYRVEREC